MEKNKPVKRKVRRSNKQSRRQKAGNWRIGWRWPLKVGLVLFVLLACGLIYLDAHVRHSFSGSKWAVPARVYARPLELFAGKQLRQDDFEEALTKTLQTLEEAGISVAIVEDIAFQYSYVPGSLAQAVWEGKDVDNIGLKYEKHTSKNEKAKLAFARGAQRKNVNVYDPAPFFVTAAGFWPAQVDGVSYYRDRHHLSEPGSLKLKPLIRQIFEDAALPTASADRPDYQ